jgi:hypothetical protein
MLLASAPSSSAADATARQTCGRFIAAAAAASLACGCSTTPAYDIVTAHNARVSIDHAQGGDQVVLRVEGKPPQPIPGLTDARIDLVWSAANSDFVVLHGASAECPQSTWLATIIDGNASLHALGQCRDKLTLTEDVDRLLIRQVPPQGAPTAIVYRDGEAVPYVLKLAAPLRRRGVVARRAEPMQDRRPGEADAPLVTAEPSPAVPAVSVRVGEDVVPTPVGAGPLPPGVSTLVQPFTPTPQSK